MSPRQPSYTELYRLGAEMNKFMEPVFTFEEIAAELGISKQRANYESIVALGTLAWRLRERLKGSTPCA